MLMLALSSYCNRFLVLLYIIFNEKTIQYFFRWVGQNSLMSCTPKPYRITQYNFINKKKENSPWKVLILRRWNTTISHEWSSTLLTYRIVNYRQKKKANSNFKKKQFITMLNKCFRHCRGHCTSRNTKTINLPYQDINDPLHLMDII